MGGKCLCSADILANLPKNATELFFRGGTPEPYISPIRCANTAHPAVYRRSADCRRATHCRRCRLRGSFPALQCSAFWLWWMVWSVTGLRARALRSERSERSTATARPLQIAVRAADRRRACEAKPPQARRRPSGVPPDGQAVQMRRRAERVRPCVCPCERA